MKYIPQIEPWIDDAELAQLAEVIQSTYITEHHKTDEFLRLIREFTGSAHATAMSNGTLAIVACLIAENIGPGDEVIVPDLTFIASSNAVRLVGAMPVFCDVQAHSLCMDPLKLPGLITPRTRAIMPVHLYGFAADMDAIMTVARAHNVLVIEDAAESFGITINGQHTGTFGDYGTFSFFGNKTITCGEGGVVLTNTEARYRALYRVKNHGRDRKGIFVHEAIGYNFCFTDLQAAVGVAQLGKLQRIMALKRRNFAFYKEHLSGIRGVKLLEPAAEVLSNYWFTNVLVEDPEGLSQHLHEHGIGSRRFFYPLHMQPCYADMDVPSCPTSLALYERGLSLPSSVLLTEGDLQRVVASVAGYYERRGVVQSTPETSLRSGHVRQGLA